MTTNVIEVAIHATNKASGAIDSVGGSIARFTGLAVAGAAAATALAIGTAAMVQRMSEAARQAGHLAERLGTTTESITALQGAARLADVDVGLLEKSLGFMNKNLSIAAMNGGDTAKVLAKFGESASALNAMPFDQKLERVADMLARIENPADRARVATELFGRSGQEMLQMLGKGSDELRKMTADVERLGAVISSDGARKADALGDAFDRVSLATEGFRNVAIEQLAPLLSGVLNQLAYWIADNKQGFAEWANAAITNTMAVAIVTRRVFTEMFVVLGDFFGYVTKGAEGFWENVLAFATFIPRSIASVLVWMATNFAKFAGWLGQLFINVVGSIASLFAAGFQTTFAYIVDMAVILGKRILDALQGNVVEPMSKQMSDAWGRAMNDWEQRSHSTFQAIGQWSGDAWEDVKDTGISALNSIDSVIDYLKEKAGEFSDAFDWSSALAQVEALRAAAEGSMTTSGEGDDKGKKEDDSMSFFETWAQKAEDFRNAHGTMVEELASSTFDLMMSTAGAIGDVFAASIVQGKNLGQALQALGKQVLTQLISMLIKMGIQRLILSKITKVAAMTEAAGLMGAAAATTFGNTFASIAAIPIIGPAMAPAAAAAALGAVTAGMAGAFATGAGTGAAAGGAVAAAHGGLDYVPAEQTYMLQRGERVVSPKQNEDLTSFLQNGGGNSGEGTTININLEEDGIYSDKTIRKLADALNRAVSKHGVRLVVNERSSKRI